MGNVLSTQRSPAIQSRLLQENEKIVSRPPLSPFTREAAAGKARMAERLVPRARLVPELVCSNFAESLRFYTELLGFSVRYSRIDERFAYLERDGAELMASSPLVRIGFGRALSWHTRSAGASIFRFKFPTSPICTWPFWRLALRSFCRSKRDGIGGEKTQWGVKTVRSRCLAVCSEG